MFDPAIEDDEVATELINVPLKQEPEILKQLKDEANTLTDLIILEKDQDKLEDLTKLFELNQLKKEIVRRNKLSKLVDAVDDELIRRVLNYPDDIDNELLLKYMTSTSNVLQNIKNQDKPLIQVTKQEINVNLIELNAESRKRVLNAVQLILNNAVSLELEEE